MSKSQLNVIYSIFCYARMMDEFFADILGGAKVASNKATPTNRKVILDDFKRREKFYSGLVKKEIRESKNNNANVPDKIKEAVKESTSSKSDKVFKNDKSSQGQNLSFDQLFQLAKTNGKLPGNQKNKTTMKKNKISPKSTPDVVSSKCEPKVPKIIIRKADCTIKKEESNICKKIDGLNKPKLDKMPIKPKSIEKTMIPKNNDKVVSTGIKRKAEEKELLASKVPRREKSKEKISYKEYKKRSRKKERLHRNVEELFEYSDNSLDDFIDDDDDHDLPSRAEFEDALKLISRYDKNRWKKNERSINENKMVSSFSDIRKEEKKSFKIALKEDLDEEKKGSRAL